MSYPYDIRVDARDASTSASLATAASRSSTRRTGPLEMIGGAGAEPGQFNNPWGMALDSKGNLYVADSLNHRVQKFIRRRPRQRPTRVGGQWSVVSGWQRTTDNGQRIGMNFQFTHPGWLLPPPGGGALDGLVDGALRRADECLADAGRPSRSGWWWSWPWSSPSPACNGCGRWKA